MPLISQYITYKHVKEHTEKKYEGERCELFSEGSFILSGLTAELLDHDICCL